MISILVKYSRRLCSLPFVHQFLITQTSETHTPTLENHNFNRWLAVFVDNFPSLWICAIALTIMQRFVVARDANVCFAGCELREDLFAERNVVGGGLAAVLNQWVIWLRVCEFLLG
jgi:hypothetical protein